MHLYGPTRREGSSTMAPLNHEESEIITHMLIDDEGIKKFPYLDCCGLPWRKCTCSNKGKLTIGIGRNLDDVGISENEAIGLQSNDVMKTTLELEKNFHWFGKLNTARRLVVLSMSFNMGISGLKEFHNMIKAIELGDFNQASIEMMHSAWSKQVKGRAIRLAAMMKTGQI